MLRQILAIDDKKDFPIATKIARSYEKGIEALSKQAWDQLYLDYDLGGPFGSENGVSVLEWLKDHAQSCPPIIRMVSSCSEANHMMARYIKENIPNVKVVTRYDD